MAFGTFYGPADTEKTTIHMERIIIKQKKNHEPQKMLVQFSAIYNVKILLKQVGIPCQDVYLPQNFYEKIDVEKYFLNKKNQKAQQGFF